MTQPANNLATTVVASVAEAPSRSFWEVAIAAYKRRVMNRVAFFWIVFLLLLAVFVPFLANGQPYTIELKRTINGSETWLREWPLFAQLTALDLILLIVFAFAVAYYFIFKHLGRKHAEREKRFATRTLALFIIIGVAGICSVPTLLWRTTPLNPYDYRRYQEMLQTGDARSAVFTVVHWSYGEQEPLRAQRRFEGPSRDHWLGTDGNGRDALSRLLWSSRVVMGIGFIAISISLAIGVVIGGFMGYFVRKVDLIGMRLVEIFESIPVFILILIFIAFYGRNIIMIMVILGITGWTGIARFVRAEFLKLRKQDYVQAAKAIGLPLHRVLFRHMLPNGLTPVIVVVTFGIAGTVMSESALSFLGVGVEPPTPSWGSMLNEAGNPAEEFRWWLAIAPGLMIFLTVFAYNIIGEGLRDAIDPRLNKIR